MPELPEVETMVRGIRPFVMGREIETVRKCRCLHKPISIAPRFDRLKRRMQDATVANVRRLAKRIVLELAGGEACVIEPRMTGLVLLSDPPDRGHLRLQWRFKSQDSQQEYDSLWFWDRRGLGTVRLYTSTEFAADLGPHRLGPDALEMTERGWQDCCQRTSRAIKVVLLDQRFVAGIGNLYASEILHRAGVHPAVPADRLKGPAIRRLHAATRDVLRDAIRYEGSTLADGTYRNALNNRGGYQNKHQVYNRKGRPCTRCGRAEIRRIVQAQRSTFFCPHCQGEGTLPFT